MVIDLSGTFTIGKSVKNALHSSKHDFLAAFKSI